MRSQLFARLFAAGSLCFSFAVGNSSAAPTQGTFEVNIQVDAGKSLGPLKPVWRFFGADEPNYATMKNGRKLLGELGSLSPGNVYFRTHNLLTSGDGTPALKWGSTGAYSEDVNGNPVYNWTILDQIFDAYHENGVKPYVEIGFMPEALSIKPEPYRHHWTPEAKYDEIFTGWSYPPTDYKKWEELVYQWAKHCVERYGQKDVESWFWETWNEANIGYWRGSPEDFRKLHDYAIAGVRRALPTARVGGPDAAGSGGRFTRAFIEHCLRGTNYATGKIGTPLDFVSFHAKGSPSYTSGHVRMGIANQLRAIDQGFRIVASYPELHHTPVVIGESDPEGCAACQGAQLGYRNGTMYSSYTAACVAREFELAAKYDVNFEGALTWAFEFENQPYFAGFRSLASDGIDKPVLNVFRMFSKMSGDRLAVKSDGAVSLNDILRNGVRGKPDVSALASLDGNKFCVLVWHYHDDDVAGPSADVALDLKNLPVKNGSANLTQYRVDHNFSNAYTAWQKMNSPQHPTAQQYSELERAGQLQTLGAPDSLKIQNAETTLHFELPRQAVSLLVLQWKASK